MWSYKLTDPKGQMPDAMNKLTTIMPEQDVGGVHAGTMAFLVHVEQLNGTKDVFENLVGDLDVRYQTTFHDLNGNITTTDVDQPFRLKLDDSVEHTTPGAQWSTTFTETSTSPGKARSTKTKT